MENQKYNLRHQDSSEKFPLSPVGYQI